MAEYAGYVATAPVNYGEITKDLVTSFITIDQAKREEDKRTQQELDKNFSSDMEKLTEFSLSSSAPFNNKISNLGDNSKIALLNGYKTGNMREVNRIKANLKTGINNINAASKVIDTNFNEIKTAISKGDISDIGTVYAEMYGDATNFNDGEFFVMPDGTIPYVKYDKDGRIVSKSSFYDPATLTSTKPFIDPNVKYDQDLNNWMKSIGTYKDEQGNVTIISPKNNPGFAKAKETKIAELTSTDRNTARFLTSVGGYVGYKSEEQKQDLLKNKNITEDKLIKVELINGVPQPILSEKQQQAAKELAEQEINQRVSFTKTLDEPRPVRINIGGKEDKLTQGEESILASGDFVNDVLKDVKLRGANTKYTKAILNSLSKAGYPLVAGTKLVSNKNGGLDVVDPKGNKITSLNTDEEFYQTLGQKTALQAGSEFNRYKQLRGIVNQESAPTPAPSPKPAPAAQETINVDIKATIAQAKAKTGKTITPAQVKAKVMRENPGKKLRWTNQ